MAKYDYVDELLDWLKVQKIKHERTGDDMVDIEGVGRLFVQNTDDVSAIFRKNKNEETEFNLVDLRSTLEAEGACGVSFKFGKNWYWFRFEDGFALNILKYVGVRESPGYSEEVVNLGVHSYFEMLNGSFSPAMWVRKAKYCGHKAIGVCDRNTMSGLYELQKACDAAEIKPVFGYSTTFNDGEQDVDVKVYVQSQAGLRNLLRIQKAVMVDSADKKIPLQELINRGPGNVLVIGKTSGEWVAANPHIIGEMQKAYDAVYFQVDFAEYKAERIDVRILQSAKAYFDAYRAEQAVIEPALIQDCYYLDADDAKNKLIVNKIAEGASHEQSDRQYFKDADEAYEEFVSLFSDDWDVDELFDVCRRNALSIAANANARFDTARNYMPQYIMTAEEEAKYGTTLNMFHQLLEDGLQRLIPAEKQPRYREQMEYEKYVIESTNNVDYLLVQYDTVNWARANGILVGCGRGSAAGSLLLYLLGITLVDPIRFGLIFERFLLPERAGLESSEVTVMCSDIESSHYCQIADEHGNEYRFDVDAEMIIDRNGERLRIYADTLQIGDKIVFDNRDIVFNLQNKKI